VYPPLVWMPAYALSETLYSTIALAAAAVLDRVGDRMHGRLPPDRLRQGDGESANARRAKADGGSHNISTEGERHRFSGWSGAIAAGVLLGIGILTRPVMVVALPLIAAWLAWPLRQRTVAAIVVAVATACVLPWTLRNARVYHRMVFVASEGGVTFWTGNHPLSRGEGDLAANPDLKRAELAFREAHPGLTAEQLEPLYYRDAFRRIADDPIWWLGLLARKAFYTVVPIGPSYTLHSAKYFAASAASYAALLPFAIAGGWRLRRAPRRPAALWLMAAATVAANLLFLPQERFRIPVIDPALIVTAAALGGAVNAAHGRADRHSDV
jgi:4-amino-4-deoxy-L-arabinose transferase-like glycosyltransferase